MGKHFMAHGKPQKLASTSDKINIYIIALNCNRNTFVLPYSKFKNMLNLLHKPSL